MRTPTFTLGLAAGTIGATITPWAWLVALAPVIHDLYAA